jgi:hypothetical protein
MYEVRTIPSVLLYTDKSYVLKALLPFLCVNLQVMYPVSKQVSINQYRSMLM